MGLRGVDGVSGVMAERDLVFERCVYWLGDMRVFEPAIVERDGEGLKIWLWGLLRVFASSAQVGVCEVGSVEGCGMNPSEGCCDSGVLAGILWWFVSSNFLSPCL